MGNTTEDAFDILDSIRREIGHLGSLKGRISAVNSEIDLALLELEKAKQNNSQNKDND